MLNRREVLKGFLGLGGGAVLAGCRIAPPKETLELTLEQRLEKELRKHDPWVLDFVQADYTSPKDKRVSLAFTTSSNFRDKSGISKGAYFDPMINAIVFPFADTDPLEGEIESISHELWHPLYHGKDPLLFSEGFSGVSKEDLPKEIKRRLEYATSYGGVYDWAETNFRIKGKIPILDNLNSL